MERFLLEEKIFRYRELLMRDLPSEERIILEALLAEQESMLQEMTGGRPDRPRRRH